MATKYPRSFIYKVYKILCAAFKAEAICYGQLSKKNKLECIYVVDQCGMKRPLVCKIWKNKIGALMISKNANRADIQKAIVLRILEALKTRDVWVEWSSIYYETRIVRKETIFEPFIVKWDLEYPTPAFRSRVDG